MEKIVSRFCFASATCRQVFPLHRAAVSSRLTTALRWTSTRARRWVLSASPAAAKSPLAARFFSILTRPMAVPALWPVLWTIWRAEIRHWLAVKNLKSRRTKLRELEQKRDKLEAEYAKLSEKEQYAKHGELDAARKLAEDALLDITKIVGGFLVVDDLDPVIAAYSKDYAIAYKLSSMEEKRQELQVDVDDAEYAKKTAEKAGKSAKDGQLQRAQEKLKQ